MQRSIVMYKSKYGATEKYAGWIAEELGCSAVPIENVKKGDLRDFDNIIYGGGVQAGGIKELDRFMKWIKSDLHLLSMYRDGSITQEELESSGVRKKRIIIFAVGINSEDPEARKQLRDINFPKKYMRQLPCFFLPGEYHPELLKGVDKMIMKLARKMLSDKQAKDVTDNDRRMLSYMEQGCNLIDRQRIRPIIEEVRR